MSQLQNIVAVVPDAAAVVVDCSLSALICVPYFHSIPSKRKKNQKKIYKKQNQNNENLISITKQQQLPNNKLTPNSEKSLATNENILNKL